MHEKEWEMSTYLYTAHAQQKKWISDSEMYQENENYIGLFWEQLP